VFAFQLQTPTDDQGQFQELSLHTFINSWAITLFLQNCTPVSPSWTYEFVQHSGSSISTKSSGIIFLYQVHVAATSIATALLCEMKSMKRLWIMN
jgi:hypothetical protein